MEENVIKQSENGNLIIISGPSGCGKGTVGAIVRKENKHVLYSVSCTTRSPREGEIDGVDYYFISKEEFERRIAAGDFLEYAIYNDNYYGTPKKEVNDKLKMGYDVILEIEIEGALKVKELVNDAIFIFIMPPSMRELRRRLEGRGTETKDKILKRFKKAYQEINEVTKYNYVVVNDIAEDAAKKVLAILSAERCRVDRIEEVYLNNEEELVHEMLVANKEFVNPERDIK